MENTQMNKSNTGPDQASAVPLPSNTTSVPSKKSRGKMWILISVGVLVLLGAGAYAAKSFLWSPVSKEGKRSEQPSTEQQLEESFTALASAKSLDITITSSGEDTATIDTTKISYDILDSANPRVAFASSGSMVTTAGKTTPLQYDFISVDKKLFLRLQSSPEIFLFTTNTANTWLDMTSFLTPVSKKFFFTQQNFSKILSDLISSKTIRIAEELPQETINGIPSRHFTLEYSASESQSVVNDFLAFFGTTLSTPEQVSLGQKYMQTLKFPRFELWIATETGKLNQVLLQQQTVTDSGKKSTPMNVKMVFSGYDEKKNIYTPENFVEYKTVVGENTTKFFNALIQSVEAKILGSGDRPSPLPDPFPDNIFPSNFSL